MVSTATVVQNRPPWVHRRFLKDCKLKVQECYWEYLEKPRPFDARTVVIPSGAVWRKYLSLLTKLITEQQDDFNWIFLESAAELMDWKNSSPSISIEDRRVPESAALNERNKIRKLLQDFPQDIQPLCDLSLREEEFDEWSLLHYESMSVVQRSSHALARAGRLLMMNQPLSKVVLLVEDEGNTNHADSGVETLQMVDFFKLIADAIPKVDMESLLAMKRLCEESYRRRNAPPNDKTQYAEFTEVQIEQGLRDGSLARGRLEVTRANPREAYATVGGARYFVNLQVNNRARALHHDVVVIQPLPESQWGIPAGMRRLAHPRSDDDEGQDVAQDEGVPVPSAQVVAVAVPSRRSYVATLVDEPAGDERTMLVVPMDIRIPKLIIHSRGWPEYVNQRLLVVVDNWEPSSHYPSGHVVNTLGPVGDLETEISCLLREHGIDLDPFSVKALASLPPEGPAWTIPSDEVVQRLDLRKSHRIFSVDPPGCQDIDDTMHAKVLPNGDIEVGVHIADVTYFVPHNSELDKEAQVRGTTFYLVDRRFDMLPSLLSSDLCSLHGNTDRLAVSVIWTFSLDLNVVKSCWYGRSVIHNCQAMTYEQAHNILHDKPPDDSSQPPPPPLTAGAPVDPSQIASLKEDLSILQRLTRKLRKDREDFGGAVDLSSGDVGSELKFSLDEHGSPVKVAPKKEMEIHHTIAEMMILANQYVATKICNSFPDSSLLRVHRAVSEDRFEELESALKAAGIEFDGSSNMALAQSLKKAKFDGNGNKEVDALWKSLATRAMSEALYVCSGLQETDIGLSHYGLGIDKYTHFTSPIRRYADVVVHKQLMAALALDNIPLHVPSYTKNPSRSRLVLDTLPDSSAISILKGEGLPNADGDGAARDDVGDDGFLDSLIEGASELALGTAQSGDSASVRVASRPATRQPVLELVPYSAAKVGTICEGLNRQNRMAKLSSMECQRLFLSLYFSRHVETARAVVTDLRVNGLIVYAPKFDLKGPLYLSDMNGDVQIDPSFVGLEGDAGLSATLGFALAPCCRRFPTGRCMLDDSVTGGSLEVVIPEAPKKCIFRPLDVITVQLSCDMSDVRARIPPTRFHLVSPGSQPTAKQRTSESKLVTSTMIRRLKKESTGSQANIVQDAPQKKSPAQSMYELLCSLDIKPVLSDVAPLRQHKLRMQVSDTAGALPGRLSFGGFQNPDTRSATQDAAIEAATHAAAQRRATTIANQSRRNEYETSRAIEREATARMQRLAAEKRSTRRSKAK